MSVKFNKVALSSFIIIAVLFEAAQRVFGFDQPVKVQFDFSYFNLNLSSVASALLIVGLGFAMRNSGIIHITRR